MRPQCGSRGSVTHVTPLTPPPPFQSTHLWNDPSAWALKNGIADLSTGSFTGSVGVGTVALDSIPLRSCSFWLSLDHKPVSSPLACDEIGVKLLLFYDRKSEWLKCYQRQTACVESPGACRHEVGRAPFSKPLDLSLLFWFSPTSLCPFAFPWNLLPLLRRSRIFHQTSSLVI